MSKEEKIANKWILEMQEFGFTPQQMLDTIALARKKYKKLKTHEKQRI